MGSALAGIRRVRRFAESEPRVDTVMVPGLRADEARAIADEIDGLHSELAALRRLRADEAKCAVCDGRPLESGRECICGGSGLQCDEIIGLRRECFARGDALDRLRADEAGVIAMLDARAADLLKECHAAEGRDDIEAFRLVSRAHAEVDRLAIRARSLATPSAPDAKEKT